MTTTRWRRILPECLPSTLRGRTTSPEPVTYGNVRLINERGLTISFLTTERSPSFIPALLHAQISPLNQQGMLFRRDVVQALGD